MEKSRRSILRGGLAALGGLVGATVAAKPLAAAAQTVNGPETVALYGSSWHLFSPGAPSGSLPVPGERRTASGSLSAEPGGDPIGEFHGVFTALREPGQAGRRGIATLEQHTFVLAGGTLIGSGAGTQGLDEPDTFAIVGGTGCYAAARGTYVARQRPLEFGGDGTAEFILTILT
jgi:hypothetical protein